MGLVSEVIPFHMKHNAEPEAVDLLIEVERLDLLAPHVNEGNYARTCLYLFSCSSYLPEPEDSEVLKVAHEIFLKVGKLTDAMRVACRLGLQDYMEKTFLASNDKLEKRQLCYMLARHGHPLRLDEGPCEIEDGDELEELQIIMSNSNLSANYLTLARDLDVMEAKLPEDIYKTHLMEGRAPAGAAVDSARANLAATFVNAFVNAGFGQDKLLTASEGDTEGEGASSGAGSNVSWIFKNKDHGKMSAAASLGSILLWDVEDGLPRVDNYLYSMEQQVVAGGLLAVGLINVNVRNDCDPAYGLLYESVNKENSSVRIGAIMGLGLAYAGCQKEEVQELLVPVVTDDSTPIDVAAFAALSLGLVFVGTCHEECVQAIVQALMLRPEKDLEDPFAHFLCLGPASFSCSVRARSRLLLRWRRPCRRASATSSRLPLRLALMPEVETFSRCRPSWRAAVSTLNLTATTRMRAPTASLKSGNMIRSQLPLLAWPSLPQQRSLDRTWRCVHMIT